MIRYLCILNDQGDPLVEKRWSALHEWGGACREALRQFWELVQERQQQHSLPPRVLLWSDLKGFCDDLSAASGFFCYRQIGDLWFLIGSDNGPLGTGSILVTPTAVLDSLDRDLLPLLRERSMGKLNAIWVREHFIAVYEILEEMYIHGLPLVSEPNVLMQLVSFPGPFDQMVANVAGTIDSHLGLDRPGPSTRFASFRSAVAARLGSSRSEHSSPSEILTMAASSLWDNVYQSAMDVEQSLSRVLPWGSGRPIQRIPRHMPGRDSEAVSSASQRFAQPTNSVSASEFRNPRGGLRNITPQCHPNAPWRRTPVHHPTEEFLIDMVEHVSAMIDGNQGEIWGWAIRGVLDCRSKLSVTPHLDLHLRLHDVHEKDIAVHTAVRLQTSDSPNTRLVLSFVPPDGAFRLASYWIWREPVSPLSRPAAEHRERLFPFRVTLHVGEQESAQGPVLRILATITQRVALPRHSENLHMSIHVRQNCLSKSESALSESIIATDCRQHRKDSYVTWDPWSQCLHWHVPRIAALHTVRMESILYSSTASAKHTLQVTHGDLSFNALPYRMGGLEIERLQMHGERSLAFKGMRCLLRAECIQIRPRVLDGA